MKDQDIVGEALASVLPQYNKMWFRVPHLLQLNFILMIPLLSSAVAGYDGTFPFLLPGMLANRAGSLMNGLQSITQWQNYFGNPSGEILGIVNAAQSIGSVISLPVVGFLSDKIGRRWTLLSGAVTIVIASAIQAASVQYGMFVFSRYAP